MKTYSVKEVAGILKITESSVLRLIKQGRLKARKPTKRYIILEQDLKRCIEGRE